MISSSDPPSVQQHLSTFIQAIEDLQAIARQANIDGRSLQHQFLTAQQHYQQVLLPVLMASPSATAFTTYQTEMHRALRLLGMDVTFLQTAKKPITVQQRQAQMQQRLKTLLDFSSGLQEQLATEESPDSGTESSESDPAK